MKLDPLFLSLNQAGLLPGPGETQEQFLARSDYCIHLKEKLNGEINFHLEEQSDILKQSSIILSKFADLRPDWTLLFFSNYKLTPWHGGCAWIFQMNEEAPTAAFIQLRRAFEHSSCYLGLYDREELLRHELVHVSRMAYQEPKYEEFLAYQTSNSAFRRCFGPLIRSSMESLLLVFIFSFIIIFDIFLLALQRHDAFIMAVWLKSIPIGLLLLALGRLALSQHTIRKCLGNLMSCLKEESKARAVLYRLTDREIDAFAKLSTHQILSYSRLHRDKELRWRIIDAAYFSSKE